MKGSPKLKQYETLSHSKWECKYHYCLAHAAEKTGVLIHCYTTLSNHYHVVLTDVYGRLPELMADLNRNVAKCLNAKLGKWESFWSPEKYSAVELVDEGAVMKAMLYTLGNPVKASLVETWSHWPGAISGPRACTSEPLDIARPEVFFHQQGSMPLSVRLETTVPPCFDDLGAKRFATKLTKGLEAYEAEKREENAAKGLVILGREAVLAQNPWDKPKSFEPRRTLNPRIACSDKWQRIEALQRLKEFREAYREAWHAFKQGARNVFWPAGTYWMRHHAGCPTVSLS